MKLLLRRFFGFCMLTAPALYDFFLSWLGVAWSTSHVFGCLGVMFFIGMMLVRTSPAYIEKERIKKQENLQ